MNYIFEELCERHREPVIDIYNHYIENSFSAYPEQRVPYEFFVPMLSSYIFMFLDSDTIGWVKERIKSPIKKALFVAAFMILSVIARWRWKHKIFSFAIDYRLFLFAKSRNKSI